MNFRPIAIALALGLAASATQAQTVGEMQQAMSMLETNVANILMRNGVEADVTTLTLSQLAEIISIADIDQSNELRSRLEAMVRP